jgi:hypothetical protein
VTTLFDNPVCGGCPLLTRYVYEQPHSCADTGPGMLFAVSLLDEGILRLGWKQEARHRLLSARLDIGLQNR